ncbi:hypothetical protein INR49_021870 [Caranx melampygus]|nr:hypothetical protein INR49_021870 [Caranx melampygus]
MKMLMSVTDLMCVCVLLDLIYSTELQPLCVCGCSSVRHSEQQHVMQVLIHQVRALSLCLSVCCCGVFMEISLNPGISIERITCSCKNLCVCVCVTFLRSQLHAGRSVFTSSVICIRFPVICSVPLHKH